MPGAGRRQAAAGERQPALGNSFRCKRGLCGALCTRTQQFAAKQPETCTAASLPGQHVPRLLAGLRTRPSTSCRISSATPKYGLCGAQRGPAVRVGCMGRHGQPDSIQLTQCPGFAQQHRLLKDLRRLRMQLNPDEDSLQRMRLLRGGREEHTDAQPGGAASEAPATLEGAGEAADRSQPATTSAAAAGAEEEEGARPREERGLDIRGHDGAGWLQQLLLDAGNDLSEHTCACRRAPPSSRSPALQRSRTGKARVRSADKGSRGGPCQAGQRRLQA